MTLLTHAIIGAGLSLNQKSLPEGFVVAFVSHFFLDSLPHNDYIYFIFNSDHQKKAYSSLLSLVILGFTVFMITTLFLITKNPAVLVGAFGASLPDIISALSNEFKINPTLFDKLHFFLHTKISLAEILLQKIGKESIKRSGTAEEMRLNYKIISGNKWGKIGWAAELLLETTILLFGLKVILA